MYKAIVRAIEEYDPSAKITFYRTKDDDIGLYLVVQSSELDDPIMLYLMGDEVELVQPTLGPFSKGDKDETESLRWLESVLQSCLAIASVRSHHAIGFTVITVEEANFEW